MRCSCLAFSCAAMFVASAVLVGCAPAVVLHTRVTHPPSLPVRAYPLVLLAEGVDDESRALADEVATRLASDGVEVTRVAPDEATRAHPDAPGAIAIVVDVSYRVRSEEAATSVVACFGSKVCGRAARRAGETHVGVAHVRTFDAETGEAIGERRVVERASGPAGTSTASRVRERLRERVAALFAPREETLELPLVAVDDGFVLRLVSEGWIHDARLAVEARLVAARGPGERAALLFDDAQLLRVDRDASAPDPELEHDARLARAQALLEAAIDLTGDERFRRASAQLARERAVRASLREEARAVAERVAVIPVPPPPPARE